eukprot:12491406-Alexandrium_andersonii.AAC.1
MSASLVGSEMCIRDSPSDLGIALAGVFLKADGRKACPPARSLLTAPTACLLYTSDAADDM